MRKITDHFGTTDAPRLTPAVTPVAPSPTTPGVPLGRLDARLLGGVPVRLTPWRGLLVPPGTDTTGLITDPASPWHGVSACTGRPGCAKSLSDVRADVQAWLGTPHSLPVHWSGCSRRCGRPAGDVIEFVATGDGYEEIR